MYKDIPNFIAFSVVIDRLDNYRLLFKGSCKYNNQIENISRYRFLKSINDKLCRRVYHG